MDSLEALHEDYQIINSSIDWISAEIKKTSSKKKLKELLGRLKSNQNNLDKAEQKYGINLSEII